MSQYESRSGCRRVLGAGRLGCRAIADRHCRVSAFRPLWKTVGKGSRISDQRVARNAHDQACTSGSSNSNTVSEAGTPGSSPRLPRDARQRTPACSPCRATRRAERRASIPDSIDEGPRIPLDVTFPGAPWDGSSAITLACGDGVDYPGGGRYRPTENESGGSVQRSARSGAVHRCSQLEANTAREGWRGHRAKKRCSRYPREPSFKRGRRSIQTRTDGRPRMGTSTYWRSRCPDLQSRMWVVEHPGGGS